MHASHSIYTHRVPARSSLPTKAGAMWQLSRAYRMASFCLISLAAAAVSPATGDMADSVDMMWGNTQVLYDSSSGRQTVSLSLDRWTTSAFRSKSTYLFGRFDIDIKLVPRDSAGTVTTVYVSNLIKQETTTIVVIQAPYYISYTSYSLINHYSLFLSLFLDWNV